MKAVLADMTVSTGGMLRLNKFLMDEFSICPGDRIIVLQDPESSKVSFRVQRGTKILLALDGAEPIQRARENMGRSTSTSK